MTVIGVQLTVHEHWKHRECMNTTLNPNHLLTFSIVARLKSITGAAKHLHIGQPAVSGQLKLLQEMVGEPLYYREGHRIILSPAGEGLLEYADRLGEELQQAGNTCAVFKRLIPGFSELVRQ